MKSILSSLFDGIRYIFLGGVSLILILFLLFILFGCLWFGTGPISFISALWGDNDVDIPPYSVENSATILNIGDVWEESNLFSIQITSIEEMSTKQFLEIAPEFRETELDAVIPLQATIVLENKNYSNSGKYNGMYALVYASCENKEVIGPFITSDDGILGLQEKQNGIQEGILKGEKYITTYSFLVPKGIEEINITLEVMSESSEKEFYRQKYHHLIL